MPESTDPGSQEPKRSRHVEAAVAIAVGSGAGAALGVVIGNVAVGIAIGAGAGVVIGALLQSGGRGHELARQLAWRRV
jgi:uncharacterized membrane protein